MSESETTLTKVVNVDSKDWFLQDLIEIVNSGKMSFDVTLTVGGFLVSGTLVGGKEYFEGFGEEFSFGLSGEAAKKVKAAFAKNGNVYTQSGGQPIVLLGGGTTKIGDPTDKDKSRPILTTEKIEENKLLIQLFIESAGKIILPGEKTAAPNPGCPEKDLLDFS